MSSETLQAAERWVADVACELSLETIEHYLAEKQAAGELTPADVYTLVDQAVELGARRNGHQDWEGSEPSNVGGAEPDTAEPAWQPRPITEAATAPRRQPEKFSGIVYADAVTLLSGEPGVGKSMVCAAATVSEILADGRVLYLDFEGTPETLLERLQAASLSEEQQHRVLYLRPTAPAEPAEINAVVHAAGPTLVVVDSYDAALAAYGLESKNEDIRAFDAKVMRPLRSGGAAILVADHVVKRREERGPYSIGGQAKLALADAHLGLAVILPLHRQGRGKLKIRAHKDRHGWLPRTAIFELASHPDTGALSWGITIEETDSADPGTGFRPTVLMERVSRYLEIQTAPVSQRRTEDDVKGNGAAIRTAITVLADEGYLTVTDGPRGARLLTSTRAYRETDQ